MCSWEICEGVTKTIQNTIKCKPQIAIICGSGLGKIAEILENASVVPYEKIIGFPVGKVHGHNSNLVFGELAGKSLVVMQGRAHPYEGYSMEMLAFPLRVIKMLGVNTLIITNAAGGLNPDYKVGDLVIIKDQINLLALCGLNPCIGENDIRFGPRFFPVSKAYPKDLRQITKCVGEKLSFQKSMHEGVYIQVSGPYFESVAEARMMRSFGADLIGMSTGHEVIAAIHLGMRVLAVSMITNKVVVDEDSEEQVNHEEVLETGKNNVDNLILLITKTIEQIEC